MNQITPELPSKDECNLAMLAHLLGIFTGFIGALILWLLKRNESTYIGEQAREALNFQITVALAVFASWVLVIVLIGMLLLPMVLIANFIFCIVAALAASRGKAYRYPLALRLVN